jgi:predicted phage terminase large subunit-like protein
VDPEEIISKIEQASEVLRAQKEKYYSSNFFEFSRDVLQWPDIYEPLHREVCDFVQNNIDKKKLLILLPRGTFKSSIITVGYTLWRIVKNPNDRVLISNATYPMAISFLRQVKDHLSKNQTLKDIFGDYTAPENNDAWREEYIILKEIGADTSGFRGKEPTVSSVGAESNVTGSHFNVAILDDLVNRDNINTSEQINKIINFYKDTLDVVDAKDGHKQIIIIGTTWHQADLYSYIMDPDNGALDDFAVMIKPAYTGEWGKGELLFPTRLGWNQLEELRRQQGPSHFAAQYLLDPVPSEEAIFKAKFKYFDESDVKPIPTNTFITVDPAISEKKEADYSAMVCVSVDKDNNWYIRDIWRDHVNPKRLIDQIFYWDTKYNPVQIGVESNAFQKVLKFYIYEEMKTRNQFIPVKELTHSDISKDERIRGLEPRYESGMVFHSKECDNMRYLEDELRRFPRGKNDDVIDALASVLEISYQPKVKTKRSSMHRSIYPA